MKKMENSVDTKSNTISYNRGLKSSSFYAFCTFIFLAGLYIFPEYIKIFSLIYVGGLMVYTALNLTRTYIDIFSLLPWVAFVSVGLLSALLQGISDIGNSMEFVISIAMGLLLQSFYNPKQTQKSLLKAVFAVSCIAVIGCIVQLLAPAVLLKFNQISLGAQKYKFFYDFYQYGYLVGFSYQTGVTGFYLGIFSGFVLCYTLFKKNISKKKRTVCVLILIISYVFILMTGKRGELLVVALLAVLFITYRFRKRFHLVLAVYGVMLAGITALLLFTDAGRYLIQRTLGSNPLSGRDVIYSQLSQFIMRRPVFGSGFGSVLKLVTGFTNGHNIYLQSLVETGIVGALILAFIFVYNLVISVKMLKKADLHQAVTVTVCLYIQLHFLIIGFVGNPLYDVYPLIMYMISAGVMRYMWIEKKAKLRESIQR